MTLRLYNTLTRQLEDFAPLAPPAVTMYVCGPTVYDDPHIGHARSAYVFEVLRRYLEFKGFAVRFVRNVTDVDDKIIQKAHETSESCEAVAARYLASYHAMLTSLGLSAPTEEPKATDHVVPDMTDFIAKLLLQGAAYEAGGDVYFAVRKCPGYGKLSNRSIDELQAGTRVEPGEGKRDPLDFALWKAAKPGEPSWKSPWGAGRPGWHIECSAMSTKYLGDTFDIHGGGVDLVFPHHENEIAQAQAAGKPFARYWVHNGLLTVNGEKMSKSLRNFITVEQALEECDREADILKFFFLGTHYRSPIDYSRANLHAAGQRFDALDAFLAKAGEWRSKVKLQVEVRELDEASEAFTKAMDNDLNTPEALAVLDRLTNLGNKWWGEWVEASKLKEQAAPLENPPARTFQEDARADTLREKFTLVAKRLEELGKALGLSLSLENRVIRTESIEMLVNKREEARKEKNFSTADQFRKKIEEQGYVIEDTAKGPLVRRKR